MRVECESVKARDLKPGDLFSTLGSEYWDGAVSGNGVSGPGSIGERVYIRTTVPADAAPDSDTDVYRLTIVNP